MPAQCSVRGSCGLLLRLVLVKQIRAGSFQVKQARLGDVVIPLPLRDGGRAALEKSGGSRRAVELFDDRPCVHGMDYKHTSSMGSSILTCDPLTLRSMNTPDIETKGGRIEYAITQAGYNPNSIAAELHISASAIYQWIDGTTKNIKEDLLWKLADLTGFEARWLSQGTGPMRIDRSVKHAQSVLLGMEPEARYTAVRLLDTLAEPRKRNGTQ